MDAPIPYPPCGEEQSVQPLKPWSGRAAPYRGLQGRIQQTTRKKTSSPPAGSSARLCRYGPSILTTTFGSALLTVDGGSTCSHRGLAISMPTAVVRTCEDLRDPDGRLRCHRCRFLSGEREKRSRSRPDRVVSRTTTVKSCTVTPCPMQPTHRGGPGWRGCWCIRGPVVSHRGL